MLDDPRKTASLPVAANITKSLADALAKKTPGIVIPLRCNVTEIVYAGDMGGVLCRLDIGGAETETPYVVSLTHLTFDRRVLRSRAIEACQRHRINKIKQQQARGY